MIPASAPAFKVDDRRLIAWYENELQRLAIPIVYDTEVTKAVVAKEHPEVVIVATGAQEVRLNLPGTDRDKVATSIEIFTDSKKAGDRVIIVGGGLVGCETALYLAKQGKQVTIVEAKRRILENGGGKPIPHMNKIMLIDLLKQNNVEIITGSSLGEVTDAGAVLIDQNFRRRSIEADTIVVAVGFKPNHRLYDELSGSVPDLYLIGDAGRVGNIMNAIWTGNEIGMNC